MPLPFSLSGRVVLTDPSDPAIAIARIVDALKAAGATDIHQAGHSVTFRAGVFRLVTSLNPLVPIGSGEVAVRASSSGVAIDYRISFRQIFVVVSAMIAVVFGPVVLTAPNVNAWEATLLLGFMWVWLFGGNVLITWVRFPRWLRRAARA